MRVSKSSWTRDWLGSREEWNEKWKKEVKGPRTDPPLHWIGPGNLVEDSTFPVATGPNPLSEWDRSWGG